MSAAANERHQKYRLPLSPVQRETIAAVPYVARQLAGGDVGVLRDAGELPQGRIINVKESDRDKYGGW